MFFLFIASSAERRRSISQERFDPGEGSDTLSKEFSRRGYNFSKHRQEDNKVKLMNSTVAQVRIIFHLYQFARKTLTYFLNSCL